MERVSQRRCSRRITATLGVAGLLFLAPPATADVLLHPGKLAGTVRLEPWTFGPSSVQLSGNPNNFSASTEWSSGDAFELTTEGDQTYGALSLVRSFPNGNFSLSSWASYPVPAGGTLSVDLTRQGGSVEHLVGVQGGRLLSASYKLSASDDSRSESYSSTFNQPGAQAGLMPMVAHGSIFASGSAVIAVFGAGGVELCQTRVDLPYRTLSLAPGEVKSVLHALTVTPEHCSASLKGTVDVHGEPSGARFTQARVRTYGPSLPTQRVVDPNNPNWRIDGLTPGNYTLEATVYYQPPSGSTGPRGSVYLPNNNPPSVNAAPGQVVERNFSFGAGSVSGAFVTTNALALRLISRSVSFTGQYRYPLPNGGPSAGGFASFLPPAPYDRTFQAVLTPGEWGPPVANFSYQDEVTPPQTYSLSYLSHANGPTFIQEGQSLTLPTTFIANNTLLVYFDVAEEPNTPEVLLSNPTLYGNRYHPQDQDSVSATFRRLATNRRRIAVKFVGPRGRYELRAQALVNGSWTRFAGSVLDMGTAVTTPLGFQVLVNPQDSNGEALPLTVQFGSVQQEGKTTVSQTDLGPPPPEGYRLIDLAPGARFLYLDSTAIYGGDAELALDYDPVALGLSPEQESQLVLQQYFCEEADEENCRWVPLSASQETSDFGADALLLASTRHTLRARTWTMGMVALTLPLEQPEPPRAECVGTPEAPAWLTAAPGTCGVTVDVTQGLAGRCIAGSKGLASCTFDGATSLPLGPGFHSLLVVATAKNGERDTCRSYVNVVDNDPPSLQVGVTPAVLWPPNHTLRPITLSTQVADLCDPHPTVTCTATSNEPDNGQGDGDSSGDIVWKNDQLLLRAERSGAGTGRVYTLTCTARDGSSNTVTSTAEVRVPHSTSGTARRGASPASP